MNKRTENTMPKYAFIDLFAGIGGFRIALESLGGKCVFTSEWDKYAAVTYKANFRDEPAGDITKIEAKDIPPHDVLCGGFPCQAFSISGKQNGFSDTRGTLFFDIARIADFHKPKVLFLENVRNLARHDNCKTLSTILRVLRSIGYDPFFEILNASYYGVPQARERIYFVCFRKDLGVKKFEFPKPTHKPICLK
ncbi:MAG: DNA cytosine methyltransferase, partial [Dehalococcoidales bacterium]|nr:DNA cytosine methyltransferase [Dehalococcoidales bacterium]